MNSICKGISITLLPFYFNLLEGIYSVCVCLHACTVALRGGMNSWYGKRIFGKGK